MLALLVILLSVIAVTYEAAILDDSEFELSIIHINDFHSRFEEINGKTLTCTESDNECYGGFSRLYAAISHLKDERPDSIILNAGDSFQGTLWYTLYKWEAVQYFTNKIPFDAHTLGNHEFDNGISGVVPYIKNLNAPVVIANVDDSEEATFQGIYGKSVIIERNGLRIGVIGVMISTTDRLSNTEKLKFFDESESVNNEAQRLVFEEFVDTIIVLSHCGYEIDKKIAKNAAPKIGLIVGGHSHSLLFTGSPPDDLHAEGEYPTIISHSDGRKILIVQALAFTRFLGNILVKYNRNGNVISWSGAPIYLNELIQKDPDMNNEINKWKSTIDKYKTTVIGRTSVLLDGMSCRTAECNLGNVLSDAMVYALTETYAGTEWADTSIALMNSGGIRNSIQPGDITLEHILLAQPFQSTFDIAELQGKYIKEALEISARPPSMFGLGVLQISGIKVVFNITNEVGNMVQSLQIFCRECSVPDYKDIELDKYYRIGCNSFLMSGKDGFDVISNNIINHRVGEVDSEVLRRFIKERSPISQTTEGRITVVQ